MTANSESRYARFRPLDLKIDSEAEKEGLLEMVLRSKCS